MTVQREAFTLFCQLVSAESRLGLDEDLNLGLNLFGSTRNTIGRPGCSWDIVCNIDCACTRHQARCEAIPPSFFWILDSLRMYEATNILLLVHCYKFLVCSLTDPVTIRLHALCRVVI